MAEEIKKHLFDINEAILSIESYLGEKRNFNTYSENKCTATQRAVSLYW